MTIFKREKGEKKGDIFTNSFLVFVQAPKRKKQGAKRGLESGVIRGIRMGYITERKNKTRQKKRSEKYTI